LQKVKVGDDILVSKKPTGTLVLDDLNPGKNLYLLSSGTGLAPFLSTIRDPETYERFEKIIVVHGTRFVSELAYQDLIENEIPNHEFFGELGAKEKLVYYPTVTREDFHTQGRVTTAIESGQLFEKIGLPRFNPETDRAMLCGSPAFLDDVAALLDQHGLKESPKMGVLGDYVIERAFVEK
jgi:ferredoxin--NADP+ reductase